MLCYFLAGSVKESHLVWVQIVFLSFFFFFVVSFLPITLPFFQSTNVSVFHSLHFLLHCVMFMSSCYFPYNVSLFCYHLSSFINPFEGQHFIQLNNCMCPEYLPIFGLSPNPTCKILLNQQSKYNFNVTIFKSQMFETVAMPSWCGFPFSFSLLFLIFLLYKCQMNWT